MNFFKKIGLNFYAFRRVLGKEKDLILEAKEKAKDKDAVLFKGAELINSIIGKYSYVAQNSIISNTSIGKFCSIGPNVVCGYGDHPLTHISTSPIFYLQDKLFDKHFYSKNESNGYQQVVIEHDVWIGANVYIKNGVKVGTGAVIGAGSVITKDVEPYAVVGGVPAKLIKYRFNEDAIRSLLKTEWWNWPDDQLEAAKQYFVTNDTDAFIKKYGR